MPDGRLGYGQLGDFVLGKSDGTAEPIREFDLYAVIKKTQEVSRSFDAVISGTNLPYLDEFDRSVDPGIGDSRYTADDEDNAYVNGSELRVRTDGFGDAGWFWTGAPRALATYSFDFWVPPLANTNTTLYEVATRKIFYEGSYWPTDVLVFQSDPADRWEFVGWGGGEDAEGIFTPDRSAWYTAKWEVDPSIPQFRMKIWKVGDTEPDWQETIAAAPYTNNWSPSIYIASDVPDEEARFDNLAADLFVPPAPSNDFTIDAVLASAPILFDVDAIVHKTFEPPLYLGLATFVSASTASVDSSGQLTIAAPAGIQQGDLLIACLSADAASSSSVFVAEPGRYPQWTNLQTTQVGSPVIHRLQTWYRFVDTAPDLDLFGDGHPGVEDPTQGITFYHYTSSSATTPVVSAKAGTILAFRHAAAPIFKTSNSVVTVEAGPKSTPSTFFLSNQEPNYLQDGLFLGLWAGGASNSTWTPTAPVTERADVSATTTSNLFAGTWVDTLDNFVPARVATPSAAEINMTQVILVPEASTTWGINAYIGGEPTFSIDSYLVPFFPSGTKHDRTLYHYDMTPAQNIYISQALGSSSAGTSLEDVLIELDNIITDLENGNT